MNKIMKIWVDPGCVRVNEPGIPFFSKPTTDSKSRTLGWLPVGGCVVYWLEDSVDYVGEDGLYRAHVKVIYQDLVGWFYLQQVLKIEQLVVLPNGEIGIESFFTKEGRFHA